MRNGRLSEWQVSFKSSTGVPLLNHAQDACAMPETDPLAIGAIQLFRKCPKGDSEQVEREYQIGPAAAQSYRHQNCGTDGIEGGYPIKLAAGNSRLHAFVSADRANLCSSG